MESSAHKLWSALRDHIETGRSAWIEFRDECVSQGEGVVGLDLEEAIAWLQDIADGKDI